MLRFNFNAKCILYKYIMVMSMSLKHSMNFVFNMEYIGNWWFHIWHKIMVLSNVSIQLLWKQYGLCYFKHNSQSHVGERILLLLIMCKIIYQRKLFNNVQLSIWSMEQHVPFLGYNDSFKTYKLKSIFDWWIIILRLTLSLWRICISLLSHRSYWWWHTYIWKIAIWFHFLSKIS